ncbi:hyaluronan-binding protein 2-like [Ostrea edulis]|uniref:hyaluronan-binding protein 2-like n=1 Tax=Ostrea edulis TaxID=37623 RepID=UPI0024AF5EF3|nr:hyaluronan-binding protein 2-like [Ostrea edulis]
MGYEKILISIMWLVSVKAGSRLLGFNFKSVSPMGQKECLKVCHRYTDCLSINFSRNRLLCELNSRQKSGTATVTENSPEAEDFIYIPRQSIPQDVISQTGACSSVTCPAGHTCFALQSNKATCIVTRCAGEPGPVYYGYSSPLPGNLSSNGSYTTGPSDVGENRYYTCAQGTVPVGGNSVKCLASGKWEISNFTCQVCTESTDPKGRHYWGTKNVTTNGLTCQRWDAQSPHSHSMPNSTAERENYCRNPDGEPRPWCYTMQVDVRWEICDIPVC